MKAGRAAKGRLAAFFLSVWMLAACTGTARAASGFTDVNAAAYYAAAVDWAVSEGITTGTSTGSGLPQPAVFAHAVMFTGTSHGNG